MGQTISLLNVSFLELHPGCMWLYGERGFLGGFACSSPESLLPVFQFP